MVPVRRPIYRKELMIWIGISLLILFISVSLSGQSNATEQTEDKNIRRKVLSAKPKGKSVSRETMSKIYDEIKTPYKYGVILKGEKGKLIILDE